MSLLNETLEIEIKQEIDIFENETVIAPNSNDNGSNELKIPEETLVTDDSPSSQECFSCKLTSVDLIKCSSGSCDKYYHKNCLRGLPCWKKEVNLCPLHICSTCFNANPKNPQAFKGNMLQCDRCPVAFHDLEKCTVPGIVGTTCPKHFSPETYRKYSAVRTLNFCVQCNCNKDLMFCKSCPAAFHKHCLKQKVSSDDFVCNRCLTRKTISFNDIVWAKVYNMRWWPALVMNPNSIPKEVEEFDHYEGEFPIKYFLGNERDPDQYYWVQSGRVYPFFYRKLNMVEDYVHHDFKKVLPDSNFDVAVQKALEFMAIHSPKPIDNSKPLPYKHIKSNRPVGDVQINTLAESSEFCTCCCNPTDPNPCGYKSLCLNRSTNTECCKNTCNVGDRCQNRRFQKLEYPKVKPFLTETRGWGLKCLEDIKRGIFVSEYCGDLIDEEECERRIRQMKLAGDSNFYFCTLDSSRIIDAGPKGNFSRFMNHSCEPNCEMRKWMVLGDVRVGIFAKKDIEAGSELTFDYQMDFSRYKKLKCNCGEKRCAGFIGKKPHADGVASSKKEAEKKLSDAKEKVKDNKIEKATKLPKGSLGKDDSAKVKKQKGVEKGDDVKVKKQKIEKDNNAKVKKQKEAAKDGDSVKKQTIDKDKKRKDAKNDDAKVKKQTIDKDDNAKFQKQKGVAKNDDAKVKKQTIEKDFKKQKRDTKDDDAKVEKQTVEKDNNTKFKKQKEAALDGDAKVKKKTIEKDDNTKFKKQKGVEKDEDAKVEKQTIEKKDNAKLKKQKGIVKDDDEVKKQTIDKDNKAKPASIKKQIGVAKENYAKVTKPTIEKDDKAKFNKQKRVVKDSDVKNNKRRRVAKVDDVIDNKRKRIAMDDDVNVKELDGIEKDDSAKFKKQKRISKETDVKEKKQKIITKCHDVKVKKQNEQSIEPTDHNESHQSKHAKSDRLIGDITLVWKI